MKCLFRILILIIAIVTLTGCPYIDPYDRGFMFKNNSHSDVYTYIGQSGRLNGGVLYPDTVLMNTDVTFGPILKGASFYLGFRSLNIDTMSLYIFSADTLKKYSWEEVKSGYKILQRYDLDVSKGGLRKLDFKVTYPPTEAMKDVHMYPPYKK